MAYRFLLEVPETLADQANIAVAEAGDAQVVVVRNAHGLGVDVPYLDLTVAAHTLRVVDSLYAWFDGLGSARPAIQIVLHGGDRVALAESDRARLVAAIRRDQPWVERTIPMIGEHEEEHFDGPGRGAVAVATAAAPAQASTALLERSWATMPALVPAQRAVNHVAVNVTDLAKAERFYQEFLSMDIVGRARRSATGYVALDGSYDWDAANRAGEPADVTYLRNGPLVLAVHRLGLGARLDRGVLDHVSLRVDATTYTTLKGLALMRPMELLASAETAFVVRDPFFVTWEFSLQGVPEFLS
jgi:catechol 2,3-dioxygenase-like lactoylglutathione lyase family enzyme